jgi:hypothetical protein
MTDFWWQKVHTNHAKLTKKPKLNTSVKLMMKSLFVPGALGAVSSSAAPVGRMSIAALLFKGRSGRSRNLWYCGTWSYRVWMAVDYRYVSADQLLYIF